MTNLIYEDLINGNNQSVSKEMFFKNVFTCLKEKGFVENSFLEAITEREKEYPTGLKLNKISISIPHTDVTHIIKPFIFINKIVNKNLDFIQMGTDDEILQPDYIIILGIKNPTEQVELLSGLLELFDKESFFLALSMAKNDLEIKEAFISHLGM